MALGIKGYVSFFLGDWSKAKEEIGRTLELYPRSVWGLLAQAILLTVAEERPDEGIAILERVRRIVRKAPQYRRLVAQGLMQAGNTAAAMRETKELIQMYPDNVSLRLDLADILDDAGQYKEGLKEVEKVLSSHPNSKMGRIRKASMLISLNEHGKASDLLDGLETDPDAAIVNAQLAFEDSGYEEAERILRGAIDNAPHDSSTRLTLIILYCRSGNPRQAEALWSDSPGMPRQCRAWLALAWAKAEHKDKAVEHLEAVKDCENLEWECVCEAARLTERHDLWDVFARKAVKRCPDQAESHYLMGLYFFTHGSKDKGVECFTRAHELDESYVPALHGWALYLHDIGAHEEALGLIEIAMETEEAEDDAQLHSLASILRFACANKKDGRKALERALELDPCENMYDGLADKLRFFDADEAIKVIRRGLDEYPDSVELECTKAMILASSGAIDKAMESLRSLAASEPDNLNVILELARLLEESGRSPEAATYFRRSFKLYPDNEYVCGKYGAFLLRQEKHKEADRVYRAGLMNSSDFGGYLWAWFTALDDAGSFDQGLALVGSMEPPLDEHPVTKTASGLFSCRKGDYANALPLLQESELGEPKVSLAESECLWKTGETEAAVDILSALVDRHPQWTPAREMFVKVLLKDGQIEWAREQLKQLEAMETELEILNELHALIFREEQSGE